LWEVTPSGVQQKVNRTGVPTLYGPESSGAAPYGYLERIVMNGYGRQTSNSFPTFDDFYVAVGPGARARVEIGNMPTYTASTVLAITTPTFWSNSEIRTTIRQGAFRPGQTAYLFVVGADGVVSERGYPITIGTPPPPTVDSIQINDGNAQRSKINSITVNFSRAVTLDAEAFTVVGRNGAGAGTVVNVALAPGSSQVATLTFSGAPVVGGSLADGVYDLRINAAKVHDATVPAQTLPADSTLVFHRLFSDVDGDGDSDNADLFQMRSTYTKSSTDPAYKWYFDYDNSAVVDNLDVFQIRFRRSIIFQGY